MQIGSPQWRHRYEHLRLNAEFIKQKLSDPKQYLALPSDRADDGASLQFIENAIEICELEETLLQKLKNGARNDALRIKAEINKRQESVSGDFAFLQRLGKLRSARFEEWQEHMEEVAARLTKAYADPEQRKKKKPQPTVPKRVTSLLKQAAIDLLGRDPKASNRDICRWRDNLDGCTGNGPGPMESKYLRNPKSIHSQISTVRRRRRES
jgi:hypothetical protein